jgi:hypothetical protein
MKNSGKLDLLVELFKAKDRLVEELNAIHARIEHTDNLVCKIYIKSEWRYHQQSGIKRLELIMQDLRDIIREELEADGMSGTISDGSQLDSDCESVGSNDIHVNHQFIQTGATEIEIHNSKLELLVMVQAMERQGHLRQTSQGSETFFGRTTKE